MDIVARASGAAADAYNQRCACTSDCTCGIGMVDGNCGNSWGRRPDQTGS